MSEPAAPRALARAELAALFAVVACGASVARAGASLVDGEGRLCATATGTLVRVAPAARAPALAMEAR